MTSKVLPKVTMFAVNSVMSDQPRLPFSGYWPVGVTKSAAEDCTAGSRRTSSAKLSIHYSCMRELLEMM